MTERGLSTSSSNLDPTARTGIDEMDRGHALELQIVRSIQADLDDSDRARLDELLQQLEDFTNAHFLAEQLLMRLHAYPGHEAHQEEHDRLMAELKEMSRSLLAADTLEPAALASNLERWLVTHIHSSDQALAEYLEQQRTET